MPRLRPLKKAEDIAAVPEDQPVLIDLSEDAAPAEKLEAEPVDDKKEVKDPPEKVEPEVVIAEPDDEPVVVDDEKTALQKQIESLTKAEEESRKRVAALESERANAQREAQQHRDEATKYRSHAEQAQYDAILNAIDANKSEADSAQRDYEAAMADSNFKAAAEAQRRGQRAEAQIVRLEEGKDAFEARQKEQKDTPERPAQTDPLEVSIANLPDPAKVWLRTHRDYMTDARKNAKIQALHWDVLDEGHKAFSQEYFDSLETHLGLRKAPEKEKPVVDDDDDPPKQTKRTPIVSAPVTRDTPSLTTGRPSTDRVTLTPQQREAAKISGISEMDYAKQVLRLQQAKKEGHYSESR